ncbi:HxlR family transcriptional regulator [Aeromicrobium flavum]|uniref:HxlR family transcriptional regulator n=1 Tax=Aeromicrobium flavum TaxID=416568 RepID=A0A512HXL8_9ACTN|nr:helix-turn-helix domain-containing protein [Aeromicrobium flavum]GEO90192.1 HxlR family transcriptional regulator [Aeromicrobium flavum]
MATSYGQFCPLAKAMEILDERWTILIVRELLLGSTRFNELRRGVPRMSPALLSKRLQSLERNGIVDHVDGGYRLTACGRDLHTAVMSLGVWGLRWVEDFGDEDLDPHLLMWDIRRTIPVAAWPAGRTCVALEFTDLARAGRWWLVVADGSVDTCDHDPGYEVAATVRSSLRTMTRVWRGDVSWDRAVRAEQVQVEAPRDVRAEVPVWLGRSMLADALAAQEGARVSAG